MKARQLRVTDVVQWIAAGRPDAQVVADIEAAAGDHGSLRRPAVLGSSVRTTVKSVQNIMRQDTGVDGDAFDSLLAGSLAPVARELPVPH
jgi:hypothetical protein